MKKKSSMELNHPLFRTESFGYTYYPEQQNYNSMMEKRQLFLRSYQFTRKKTLGQRIKGSLVRVKKVVWLIRLRSARRFRRRFAFSVFRIKFSFCYRNHHHNYKYRKTDFSSQPLSEFILVIIILQLDILLLTNHHMNHLCDS